MFYFLTKTLITALIVAAVSELARRYTMWAALLASLPLTSILAFIWVYWDTKDSGKITELSYSVFWLVFPSLAFFLILPFLLKQGLSFPWAMLTSAAIMAALYGAGIWLFKTITEQHKTKPLTLEYTLRCMLAKMEAGMKELMIGKLAELTGVSAETLRYYEKMKLIIADSRSPAGYRLYSPDAVRVVRFIRGAKELHFTLDEIRQLLVLKSSDKSTCAEILKHTEVKIKQAEARILELKEIKKVLKQLAEQCPADDSPLDCCPILDHINQKSKAALAALAIGISALFATPHAAEAKPISYVGGTMMMQENDETGHTLSLDYTIDPKLAVGLYAKQERGGTEFKTIGPQVNTLIKRWNMPDGQANIFNMTGAGVSRYHGDNEFSAWTGILADYETRRIFTSYEIRGMYAGDIEKSVWQRARVGVAPYIAGYDDLNTWFMVQVDHHPAKPDNVVVTPLVRFFYKTTLVEAGYSSNNHVMLNWQLQF